MYIYIYYHYAILFSILRYVDHVFVNRQHGEDKQEQFHEYVNSIHPTIKLTLALSATNLSLILVSQYRLTAPIYILSYVDNPLIDMDASITKALT